MTRVLFLATIVVLAAVAVADQERALAEGTVVNQDVLEARSLAARIAAELVRARQSLAMRRLGRSPDPSGLWFD